MNKFLQDLVEEMFETGNVYIVHETFLQKLKQELTYFDSSEHKQVLEELRSFTIDYHYKHYLECEKGNNCDWGDIYKELNKYIEIELKKLKL